MRTTTSQSLIKSLLLVCAMLCVAATAFASPPPMFSYQGRLTDPGGNPVPDGVYSVQFQIWNAPAAGLSLWSSGSVAVTTSDGLFSVKLGQSPQPSLPVAIFYDSLAYLGITVGIDPEIVPRTQLVSSPYSLTTGTIESAQGGRVFGDLYMNNGAVDYVQTNQFNNMIGTWNAAGIEATRLWGPIWGQFIAFNSSGVATASLSASLGATPFLDLSGSDFIFLQGITGDNAAFFPTDAINSIEMLDEPGIAQNFASVNLSAPTFVFEDVVSVTITTPSAGYIYVHVDAEISVSALPGANSVVVVGISNVSAGAPFNSTWTGNTSAPNSGRFYDMTSVSATESKPAGTYTYYFVASRQNAGNAASVFNSRMKAFYFPTSYGPVVSPVPPSEATAFSESTSVLDEKTGTPMKMVDLRELELKAAKLKAEATAAELALVKARNTQHLNPTRDGSSADDKR